MKFQHQSLTIGIKIICLVLLSSQLTAQESQIKTINKAISTWQAFNQRVQLKDFKNKTSPDSIRFMGATATIFGQTTHVEIEFLAAKKKKLKRLMINFPKGAKLTTDDFKAIIGQGFNEIMPSGVGMGVGLKKFEVVFQERRSNKVDGATLSFILGSWAPFKGNTDVSLSEIKAFFKLSQLAINSPQLQVDLKSYLFLPQNIAKNLNIGQTKLLTTGTINTTTKYFSISADLASQGIPLVTDRSVMLNSAKMHFAFAQGKPKLGMSGQIQLKDREKNLMPALNGQVSIDITGKIYGEAWMSKNGAWNNPFGLNPNVSITKMGFGFGVNFMTTPIPTPILGMEGGFAVKDSKTSKIRFSGSATLGVDMGDPTKCVIDVEVQKTYLSDIVNAFGQLSKPNPVIKQLKKVSLSNLHLTIVPPGPGVKIFGVDYNPGFYAEGAFQYGKSRGAMLIDIKPNSIEAFGSLTPIIFTGFSLTGANGQANPSLFLALKPDQSTMALALNGALTVLDVRTTADIYLSDAGFSAKLSGKIFNSFSADLDVTGTDLINGQGLYVKVSMQDDDNLVQKITDEASAELTRLANEVQSNYDKASKEIERLTPQLNKSKKDLEAKQAIVRKRWESWCSLMNQRKAQETEKKTKQAKITALKSEIATLETKLQQDRYAKATALNPTACSGNSKPYNKYCYSPKSGYKWDILQPVNGSKATFKPEKRQYTSALTHGAFNVFSGCPSGQWGDALTGKCHSCPSGYKKDGLNTKCVKVTPIEYQPAIKGQYIGCGSKGSFADLTTGKCWKCPTGYERKASVHHINSTKGCELVNLAAREKAINDKKIALAALETEMTLITKGIGELATKLTGVGSNICNKIKDTDAINADPEVQPAFAKWSSLSLTVNEFKTVVETVGKTQVGALRATAWVVKNGGQALKIVDIDKASFKGCISRVNGGTVALKVKGTFAGSPLDASFKINLKNPEADIKAFAKLLLGNPNPKTTYSNGTCTKPNVPRPQIQGGKIGVLMKYVNSSTKSSLGSRPKPVAKPSWVGETRFNGKR